ncbi:hypothetical protein [Chitinivorax sp. B]|uniref:hypothetical protein n=1 Tax=Chitinivorax sp. B TaxID=2502235 RepID=UPI0010F88D3E|nr:hypothetical protein [Chitinivorax sp. B]
MQTATGRELAAISLAAMRVQLAQAKHNRRRVPVVSTPAAVVPMTKPLTRAQLEALALLESGLLAINQQMIGMASLSQKLALDVTPIHFDTIRAQLGQIWHALETKQMRDQGAKR